MRLFTIFAPVTVPAYVLFLALANLLGFAYYIVVEATLTPILRRPVSLSRKQVALFAIPVVLLAPIATFLHLILWAIRLIGRGISGLGHWQTGIRGRGPAFALGLIWLLAAAWTTAACFNPLAAMSVFSDPLAGRKNLLDHMLRPKTLGDMPQDMQVRRQAWLGEARQHESDDPKWQDLKLSLEDDKYYFSDLPGTVIWGVAGIPWYYFPAELSRDGTEHVIMILGALIFLWMLLPRWPGVFSVMRSSVTRLAFFAVRVGVCVGAIVYTATWRPISFVQRHDFVDDVLPLSFRLLSPALWAGVDYLNYSRVEWLLFNVGLWLCILGVVSVIWWAAWRMCAFLGWPRFYVAFISSRLLQRKRIAFFSVGAVSLCVAMMIIVISVMGGFADSIRAKAHSLLGDLVMDGGLQGFPYYQEFIDHIKTLSPPTAEELSLDTKEFIVRYRKRTEKTQATADKLVHEATPLIHTYGVLQMAETRKTTAVAIWGIRLDEYVKVNNFGHDLFYSARFGKQDLAKQTSQPVYGYDDKGIARLPAELEKNYADYLARLPADERDAEIEKFRRNPGDRYFGPGVFKLAEVPSSGPSDEFETRPGYEGKAYPGVIVGRDTIFNRRASGEYSRREYPIGSAAVLTMLPLTRGGAMRAEPPPKPAFRYVDDSRTGIHEIDSRNVYVDFGILQELLSMVPEDRAEGGGKTPARCKQIQIKLNDALGDDREKLGKVKELIKAEWDDFMRKQELDRLEMDMVANVEIQTWEEMQRGFIAAVEKEKVLVVIMFGVISTVAVFLILCIFYMIVQEKTRDIGILKSIGASAEGVTAVFLSYGAAIGLVGAVIGSIMGIQFVLHINDIQEWLARLNPDWRVWSPETYSFDKIPDMWKWSDVISISILSITSSILGAAFPAMRAGRTWPVESLRYE